MINTDTLANYLNTLPINTLEELEIEHEDGTITSAHYIIEDGAITDIAEE